LRLCKFVTLLKDLCSKAVRLEKSWNQYVIAGTRSPLSTITTPGKSLVFVLFEKKNGKGIQVPKLDHQKGM